MLRLWATLVLKPSLSECISTLPCWCFSTFPCFVILFKIVNDNNYISVLVPTVSASRWKIASCRLKASSSQEVSLKLGSWLSLGRQVRIWKNLVHVSHFAVEVILLAGSNTIVAVDVSSRWCEDWQLAAAMNSSLVDDPTIRFPGFHLSQCHWSLLNRFQSGQCHSGSCQKKYRAWQTMNWMCHCGDIQTMSHTMSTPAPWPNLTAVFNVSTLQVRLLSID